MKTKEIMCCADFERIFNVRIADKCCATCKHSDIEIEGEAKGEKTSMLKGETND